MIRATTLVLAIASLAVPARAQDRSPEGLALLADLNAHATVAGTDSAKSYKLLFDAWLDVSTPPRPFGDDFNVVTIWPGMDDWAAVSSWAESNPEMAKAILQARDRKIIGLPYGEENVPRPYREAGLMVAFAPNKRYRIEFPYLDALNGMTTFATAEIYRLMEAGQVQQSLDLSMAFMVVLRQFCDRDFLEEKTSCIWLLNHVMSNQRDIFFNYQDKITPEQLTKIAWWELPYLRPDRGRLFMPEGDRKVAEGLMRFVYDEDRDRWDTEKFVDAFAEVQAGDRPLTQFGAAARWKMLAEVHGSLDASLERLTRIYDDWWRRWRVAEYDAILDISSQFERTNEIRYAAVIESIDDLQQLFPLRNQLVVEVFGTAVAAGLCAYKQTYGAYPRDSEMIYAHFVRKICDFDQFDVSLSAFQYRQLDQDAALDTPDGRITIRAGEAILYSVGQNHVDDRGREHSDDGYTGDIIIWPPIKAMEREQGLID